VSQQNHFRCPAHRGIDKRDLQFLFEGQANQRRAREELARAQAAKEAAQRREAARRAKEAEMAEKEAMEAARMAAQQHTKDSEKTLYTWKDDAKSVLKHAGPQFTTASIQKAWLKKSVFWHPDKWTGRIQAWVAKRKAFSMWKSAKSGKSFLAQLIEDQQKILNDAKDKLLAEFGGS
jgi:hypothetical protein